VNVPVEVLRERVRSLMPRARDDLAELVSMRSVADPRQYPVEECLRAARRVAEAFAEAGLQDARLIDMPYGHPAVYGYTPGPPGSPTVLLYCHYDVQPPLDEGAWTSPPFELRERDGRWYGRGAADCKGNIVMHLTALRALGARWPVGIKLIAEGSEEQGLNELEEWVPGNPQLLRADSILVGDGGNFAAGVPTLTVTLRGVANVVVTVRTLRSAMHSGMFGGPAPDALAALVAMLASLRDAAGNTTVRGLDNTQRWEGIEYPEARFRADANVLDGVGLLGDGTVADMLWARPALTVLGIDCPPVVGSAAAIQPAARARLNLRVPPGMSARAAQDALVAHLRAVAPWNAQVEVERDALGEPWTGSTDGPAARALGQAMREAYGREQMREGQGGSIPLCNVLKDTFPGAEMMILGVEEPRCLIHAPNESVDPSEIERMALSEALFLEEYGVASAAAQGVC
jgi:acetylornithine deacetylase/succinyl-diaminopimelate desuccinylase-like protein